MGTVNRGQSKNVREVSTYPPEQGRHKGIFSKSDVGKLALKARVCSGLVACKHIGPQHNTLAFGSTFWVLWRKGLLFSPGLGKVRRCPLDKSCYLVQLGLGSAPTCPGLSCPLSSNLEVSGTPDCIDGQHGQVQKA